MSHRIPQREIDRVTEGVDIVDVISDFVRLKAVGQDRVGLCPFHDENTPSFSVTPSKQVFFCFGCGATGDVVRFVERFEGKSFLEALSSLADRAGLPMPEPDRRPTALEALSGAMAFYQKNLSGPSAGANNARRYLADRGIDTATAQAFGLGYAPAGGQALLSALSADRRKDLEHIGLIDPLSGGGYRDRFRDRLVIPVRTPGGQVVGATARALGDARPKYLNSQLTQWFRKDRLLFGLDQLRRSARSSGAARAKRTYVVEGPTDVLSGHSAGEAGVVGILGRSVSPEQVRQLLSVAEEVVFTFDGDKAGVASIGTTLQTLIDSPGNVGRMRFKRLPEGLDPSSMIHEQGIDAFRDAPEMGFLDALISMLPEGEGRSAGLARAEEGLAMVNRIRDPLLKESAIHALSEASGLSAQALLDRLQQMEEEPVRRARAPVSPPVKRDLAASALWRSLLESPELVLELSFPDIFAQAENPAVSVLPSLKERVGTASAPALSSVLDDLGIGEFVKTVRSLPAPTGPKAEAIEALRALERPLVQLEIDRTIARVRDGEILSDQDRERYRSLLGRQQNSSEEAYSK